MKDRNRLPGMPERKLKNHRRKPVRIFVLLVSALMLTLGGSPHIEPLNGTLHLGPPAAAAEELPVDSVIPHFADRFYLRNMAPELQRDAAAIYQGIAAFEDEIELPDKLDSGSVERIISALRYDCPELFQVNFSGRYSMKTRNGEVHAVRIPYGMGKEEYGRKLAQCREILAQLVRNTEGIGREEAERYVYECLTDWITYSTDAPHCANASGALLGRAAKCDGISLAMKWAMEELGIPAFVISGQDPGDPSGHAWNCVQIDGIWYDVDLTNDSATAGRSMKIYPAYNVRREWMTRLYPVFPDIAAYYNIPASDRMDRSFHVLNGSFVPAGADVRNSFFALLDAAYAASGAGTGQYVNAGPGVGPGQYVNAGPGAGSGQPANGSPDTGLIQFEAEADYQTFMENYGNYLDEWFRRRGRGGSFDLSTKSGFRTAGFRLTVE